MFVEISKSYLVNCLNHEHKIKVIEKQKVLSLLKKYSKIDKVIEVWYRGWQVLLYEWIK